MAQILPKTGITNVNFLGENEPTVAWDASRLEIVRQYLAVLPPHLTLVDRPTAELFGGGTGAAAVCLINKAACPPFWVRVNGHFPFMGSKVVGELYQRMKKEIYRGVEYPE